MLALLKLLQSLVKTLHSEGTPTQIAAGFALGAALGLTPLLSLHNLLVVVALAMLNVSFGAGLLGMTIAAPFGFMLDPVFDRIGRVLLMETPSLVPLWTRVDNTPGLALSGLTNTVSLGSLVVWLALWLPIFVAMRFAVVRYRTRLVARLQQMRFYQLITASKAYNVYRWFSPS